MLVSRSLVVFHSCWVHGVYCLVFWLLLFFLQVKELITKKNPDLLDSFLDVSCLHVFTLYMFMYIVTVVAVSTCTVVYIFSFIGPSRR